MPRILLGVTGSVAAINTPSLAGSLCEIGDVRIVATESARNFLTTPFVNLQRQHAMSRNTRSLFFDEDEWTADYHLGDPVLHIDLRRWASCLVIAPLDANTLAKLHHGLCDNLLTCIYRAWDWTKPVFVAPAMNTMMWDNSPTPEQIQALIDRGVKIIEPVEKRLACNDVGMGAMAPARKICETVQKQLRWQFPLKRCNGIPINHHPGAFGFHRKSNFHTGVDLYCQNDEPVCAVEDGMVVKVDVFTGPKVGHDWWEETWGVMVEGASGVINYGEVNPAVKEGDMVGRGTTIGYVKRVLFEHKFRPDIPGHSTSMLHFELYKPGTKDFTGWEDPKKNPDLLDPTPQLLAAVDAPLNTLSWDNAEERTVG